MVARYEPDVSWEGLSGAKRLLQLGGDALPGLEALEVRHVKPPVPVLAAGRYVFERRGGFDVLVCVAGTPPVARQQASEEELADGHELAVALAWFDHFWGGASGVAGAAEFQVGDRLRLAGDDRPWTVDSVELRDGHYRYGLVCGAERVGVFASDVEGLIEDIDTAEAWIGREPVDGKRTAVALTLTKLSSPLTDVVYSYLASRTVFRPYQFRPVLKLTGSDQQRLLIADEVGLGKTIEAGLVWTELEARSSPSMRRALVVCPAALQEKWRSEMARRFDRQLEILDNAALDELVGLYERGDFETDMFGIVSMERLRVSDRLARLVAAEARFDLVIVDEAHILRNPGTKSHTLGELLSDWADVLLLLSATPLNLRQGDLFSLVHLLDPVAFPDPGVFANQLEPNRALNAAASQVLDRRLDPRSLIPVVRAVEAMSFGGQVTGRAAYRDLLDLLDRDRLELPEAAHAARLFSELNVLSSVVTRTRKIDVPEDKVVREAIQIPVTFTPAEDRAYQSVRRWATAKAAELNHPPGFAAQMPLRQAASCLAVSRQNTRLPDAGLEDEALLLVAEGVDEDEVAAFYRAEANLDGIVAADQWAEMRAALNAVGDVDTKFDALVEALRSSRMFDDRPILLFSFFKGTLRYLEERLGDEWRVRRIDGDVPPQQRLKVMADFRARRFDILLASEVASEGLDFEFAGVIVNYDLPWNPMKVEQRIGRLDRFGQVHDKIFVVNFHVPGTIETDIMLRLYRRIDLFKDSIGDLEPILGETEREMLEVAFDPELTDDERARRIEEMATALEGHRVDLERLDEARHQLATIDEVLIKDFEQRVNERGRFIGPAELRGLLEAFFADGSRARVTNGRDDQEIQIIGDSEIADRLQRHARKDRQRRVPGWLLQGIRAGDPMPMTLSNDDRRADVPLLSHQHPMVRAAVDHFTAAGRDTDRFGEVEIDGPSDDVHLVLVWRVEARGGIRHELELWTAGVSLRTGSIDDDVGDRLLAAVGDAAVRDASSPWVGGNLAVALGAVKARLEERQLHEGVSRRARNEELVDARIQNYRSLTESKIASRTATLDKVEERQIRRLHEGAIRNLHSDLERRRAELDGSRSMSLSPTEVGVFVVHEVSQRADRGPL